MKAAVVTTFGEAPRYSEFPEPNANPDRPGELVLEVLAAGLHPRVRSQAAGSHYTSTDELPLVPGVDGVGRDGEGRLRYFALADTTRGSMAERVLVDARQTILLDDDADPVAIAAGMNPVMSSWVALRRRIRLEPGSTVLVIGATGSAGRMAVQVAKHLGASRVVAAGRNVERLASLTAIGADVLVPLAGDPGDAATRLGRSAADVDVVLDFVWGDVSGAAMAAIVTARTRRADPLSWIQIGSVGGATAALPAAAFRSVPLQLVGSGQGSVSTRDFLAELPLIAAETTRGTFAVESTVVPLADVEGAWAGSDADGRVVLVP